MIYTGHGYKLNPYHVWSVQKCHPYWVVRGRLYFFQTISLFISFIHSTHKYIYICTNKQNSRRGWFIIYSFIHNTHINIHTNMQNGGKIWTFSSIGALQPSLINWIKELIDLIIVKYNWFVSYVSSCSLPFIFQLINIY